MNTAIVATTTAKTLPDICRIKPFNGTTLKDGKKIFVYTWLTGYAFAITNPKPEKEKDLQNRKKANKICRHIILNTLSNASFNVYCPNKIATEI